MRRQFWGDGFGAMVLGWSCLTIKADVVWLMDAVQSHTETWREGMLSLDSFTMINTLHFQHIQHNTTGDQLPDGLHTSFHHH
jgi:hypothetical protein